MATAIASCLEKQKFDVYLLSVIGLDRERLTATHGFKLGSKVKAIYLYDADKAPRIPHSLSVLMTRTFALLMRKIRPDVVIFNDDMPVEVLNTARGLDARVLLYINLSYLSRNVNKRLMYFTTEWDKLETLFNTAFLASMLAPPGSADAVFANSTATKSYVKLLLGLRDIEVLHPPLRVDIYRSSCKKGGNLALHAARQDRTFLESMFCDFITRCSVQDGKLSIVVGRNRSRRVAKLAEKHPMVHCVKFLPSTLWARVVQQADFYLHFKWFEGFGIATAEAASQGAVPIVFRSPLNGSWTDIVEGRQCFSFSSVDEAVSLVESYRGEPAKRRELSHFLVSRLRRFRFEEFSHRLLQQVI